MFDTMKCMKNPTRTPGEVFVEDGSVSPQCGWERLTEELATIGDDDLEVSIVELRQQMDADHAEWLMRIGEYDRRQLADVRHRLSTTGWLRSTFRMTGRAASSTLRQSRGLLRMPKVAAAATAGVIGPAVVALLDRARRRHPDEFSDHESVFADVASYLDPTDMRRAVTHWEQQVDYPSAVARAEAQRSRRRLSMNQTWDGMWAVSGELDPETGSLVDTALRSIADRSNLDSEDRRRPWQVRADALAELCEHSLRRGSAPTSGGVKPHVTLTIDTEALLGLRQALGTIDDTVVPPSVARRLSCDSTIVRMILDEHATPIDVGRATRTIPPALRRALDARDRGCQWTGCDAPTDWCDAHHIEHWADGGPTDLTNLVLLCRTHHTAMHQDADAGPTIRQPRAP